MIKTIILFGGPSKGTRFRPLSMDVPKPLFPVAGYPMIYHHIQAAGQIDGMKEILLIGSYQPDANLKNFISLVQDQFKIIVRYLQEFEALGTAGALYHFRDQILAGNPSAFFVMNADVCGDFPLQEMLDEYLKIEIAGKALILATEATREQSLNYGCIVEDPVSHQVLHYVEKPDTFISSLINCGIYLFGSAIFNLIASAFKEKQEAVSFDMDGECASSQKLLRLEQDVFVPLAGSRSLFVLHCGSRFWSQIKTPSAAIYANRHYLKIYRKTFPERLAKSDGKSCVTIGDVFIHATATVHPTATLGPNVSVGENVTVGPGARIRESIVLAGAQIKDHACVLYAIVGWGCVIGRWTRIEGTPNDPNPNKAFAKLDCVDTFSKDGRLNPSNTIIGANVKICDESVVLNCIVMPYKELMQSFKNQIIL